MVVGYGCEDEYDAKGWVNDEPCWNSGVVDG